MKSIVPSRLLQHNQITVLTTQQIAEAYGTDYRTAFRNFTRNKERYTEGKHYFTLEGEELRAFLSGGHIDHDIIDPKAPKIYLWTEKGAWLLAKSLETDEAWQACELLVDNYYRQKEVIMMQQERIKKLASLIGKNMTVPSLPANTLNSVSLDGAEMATARLRALIKPFREYVEKAQKKRAIYLSTQEGQQLVELLQAMHENLNKVYNEVKHQETVMMMGDLQYMRQDTIIKQVIESLQLPTPPELLQPIELQALPEPE